MKAHRNCFYALLSILGFIIFALGLMLAKSLSETDGVLKALPYICVGLGAGIFGGDLGEVIKIRTLAKNPQVAKQIEIEQRDERNRAIDNKAKARAYDLMIFAFSAILLAFALMQVDLYVVLTLVATYLFCIFANIYYLAKYHKEM